MCIPNKTLTTRYPEVQYSYSNHISDLIEIKLVNIDYTPRAPFTNMV